MVCPGVGEAVFYQEKDWPIDDMRLSIRMELGRDESGTRLG
jgi:hypothetical protein